MHCAFKFSFASLFLFSFFSLTLTQTLECFNPNLTRIYPEEVDFDFPKSGMEIIIDMRNDDNQSIVLDYDNPLYNEIQCVQNGTLLYKTPDAKGKIKCVYTCDYTEIGQTKIDVKFDNETLKEYRIGKRAGDPDFSKTNIITQSSEFLSVSGSKTVTYTSIDIRDYYGYKVTYGDLELVKDRYRVYLDGKKMSPRVTDRLLFEKTFTISKNYTLRYEFVEDDGSITLIKNDYIYPRPGDWDPSRSNIIFPLAVRALQSFTINFDKAEDEYGNNIFKLSSRGFTVGVYYAGELVKELDDIVYLTSPQYTNVMPSIWPTGTMHGVQLSLCSTTNCKFSAANIVYSSLFS